MTRSQLVLKIAQLYPNLFVRDIEQVVTLIFDEMANALSQGNRVELRGFGTFFTKQRRPRLGRNPRTGAKVSVEPKVVPFFKTGRKLQQRLNAAAASN